MAAPQVVSLAKDDPEHRWVPYKGPYGGQGWQSLQTGEIRYQDDPPEKGEMFDPNTDVRTQDQSSVHDGFSAVMPGDKVMVLPTPDYHDEDYVQGYPRGESLPNFEPGEDDREPYKAEYIRQDGDFAARQTWAVIEDEDGDRHNVSSSRMFVVDGVMPEEGEPVDYEDVEPGDRIKAITGTGNVDQHVVVKKEEDSIQTYREMENGEGGLSQISRKSRMTRLESGVEIDQPEVVVNKPQYDDFGYGSDLTERETREIFTDMAKRADSDVMSDAFGAIEQIEDKSERNAWNGDKNRITFQKDASESTLAHELMHGMLESEYGYAHRNETTAFAKFFVNTFPGYDFGRPASEVYQEMVFSQIKRHSDESEDLEDIQENLDTLSETIFEDDFTLSREDFLLTLPDDKSEDEIPDTISNFVDEVNKAWNKTFDAYEEEGKNKALQVMPYRPYAVTNAHELAAGIQEIMNSNEGKESHIAPIMDHHPGLIESYLNLIEPSESAKEVMERTTENGNPAFEFDRGDWEW